MRLAIALAALALGCAVSDGAPEQGDPGLSPCASPRPQVCTKDYRPVCGHRCAEPPCDPRDRRTYGNACDACSHPEVAAFAPGSCEGAAPAPIPKLR